MTKPEIIIGLFVILFLIGCQTSVEQVEEPEEEIVEIIQETVEENHIEEENVQEDVKELIKIKPVVKIKRFAISADEKKFDPDTIEVDKGDKVIITFNFNDKNIYFGGLDIRSDYFNVEYRKSDSAKSKTAEFVAEEPFTYTGYWPSSNKKKASGKVEVK